METKLIMLGIALVSVVEVVSEYDCESRVPECLHELPFSEGSIKTHRQANYVLPSEEFLTENCEKIIENLKCSQSYYEACPERKSVPDRDLLLAKVNEICDKGSDLRKVYTANVDCFNRINFTSEVCSVYFDATKRQRLSKLEDVKITSLCMQQYLLKPCILHDTAEACGDEAKQLATDIMSRVWVVYKCDVADEEEYENTRTKIYD